MAFAILTAIVLILGFSANGFAKTDAPSPPAPPPILEATIVPAVGNPTGLRVATRISLEKSGMLFVKECDLYDSSACGIVKETLSLSDQYRIAEAVQEARSGRVETENPAAKCTDLAVQEFDLRAGATVLLRGAAPCAPMQVNRAPAALVLRNFLEKFKAKADRTLDEEKEKLQPRKSSFRWENL